MTRALEHPFWNFRNNSLPYALPGKTGRTTKVDDHKLPHYLVNLTLKWNNKTKFFRRHSIFLWADLYEVDPDESLKEEEISWPTRTNTALVLFLAMIRCGTATVSADHTQLGKWVQSLPWKSWFFRQYIQTQTWLPNVTLRPIPRWHEETQQALNCLCLNASQGSSTNLDWLHSQSAWTFNDNQTLLWTKWMEFDKDVRANSHDDQ